MSRRREAQSSKALTTAWVVLVFGTTYVIPSRASNFSVLYQFTGGSDGALPGAGYPMPGGSVAFDSVGNLYGETANGGDRCAAAPQGCGTVYKIDPSGHETTLVTFLGANGALGLGNVTVSGTTIVGPAYEGKPSGDVSPGLIFTLNTSGSGFRVLHSFTGPDGLFPEDTLRLAAGGVAYGVTFYGGASFSQNNLGFGVLYQLKSDGSFAVLHSFSNGADGGQPTRIVLNSNGTIYGATGSGACPSGGSPACGVIYSYVPSTGAFTVLYSFPATSTGSTNLPGSNAIGGIASNGALYGSTVEGGTNGDGSLFEFGKTANGTYRYQTIYSFKGGTDGLHPPSPPFVEKNGNLIGVSNDSGVPAGSAGTLYMFANGAFTTLYTFPGLYGSAPTSPQGTPTVDSSGTIYGTTLVGGSVPPCESSRGVQIYTGGCGTVYKLSP